MSVFQTYTSLKILAIAMAMPVFFALSKSEIHLFFMVT